ncbi:MAG: hypothetical protein ND866_02310 [Pyrinomonadaceae bacterium]|nr:hypothetical protein [Pyrinomonadaceae bacterium]
MRSFRFRLGVTLRVFTVLVFATLSLEPLTVAQTLSKPKTVLDYYLLLPEKYFEADNEQRVKWMLDPSRGAVVDIRNGYLYAPGDGAQTSIYVCLFKKPNGSYVIAVKSHESDTDEYTQLDFYLFKAGKFMDASSAVLPVRINEEFKYEMPRYSKEIQVRNKRGRKIYSLIWLGNRFVMNRS